MIEDFSLEINCRMKKTYFLIKSVMESIISTVHYDENSNPHATSGYSRAIFYVQNVL